MVTETLTESQQNDSRTYYIVFDTDGNIRKINSSPVGKLADPTLTQIESNNPVCKKLIKGQASVKKYGIIWDLVNDKWNIGRRSTKLILESSDNKLLPFKQNVDKKDTELFVDIHYNDHTAVVHANKVNIQAIKNLSDIQEISTNKTDLLDIYVTKKNDPDYLITVINIDPLTLFKDGAQTVQLDEKITKHVDWSNISMYAKPVFENYGFKLLATRSIAKSAGSNKILRQASTDEKTSININVVDNQLTVNSDLTKDLLYFFEGSSVLKFIVCNEQPDNFVGAVSVPVNLLIDNNTITTTIDFKWPEKPLLLYKSNYITLSTGEKYDTE
jgi:hypothetical protein